MERKALTIGLFGLGVVGTGLYEILQKTPTLRTTIKKICVKQEGKPRMVEEQLITYNKLDILLDPEINVVVELIDDADAAFDIVSTALKQGKAVVSANKKMIAEHLDELVILQRKHNTAFLYEAACCASMPIIRNLEEFYNNDLLESIEGIVNGSTNYILTKIFEEKLSYNQSLKQAKEHGYAESDPRLDTEGFDAKFKLIILIAHAFGIVLKPEEVLNIGINNIGDLELKYAAERGSKVKLVAKAFKSKRGGLCFFVVPQFIEKTNPLFFVDDVFNCVVTKTVFADTQFFVGRGAGAYPTASAALSDLSALTYDYKYEYRKMISGEKFVMDNSPLLDVWLRCLTSDVVTLKAKFQTINEQYSKGDTSYIKGSMDLDTLAAVKCYEDTSLVLT